MKKLVIYEERVIGMVTQDLIDALNRVEIYDLETVRERIHRVLQRLSEDTVGEPPELSNEVEY